MTYQYGHECQWWFVLSNPISAAASNEYLIVLGAYINAEKPLPIFFFWGGA